MHDKDWRRNTQTTLFNFSFLWLFHLVYAMPLSRVVGGGEFGVEFINNLAWLFLVVGEMGFSFFIFHFSDDSNVSFFIFVKREKMIARNLFCPHGAKPWGIDRCMNAQSKTPPRTGSGGSLFS